MNLGGGLVRGIISTSTCFRLVQNCRSARFIMRCVILAADHWWIDWLWMDDWQIADGLWIWLVDAHLHPIPVPAIVAGPIPHFRKKTFGLSPKPLQHALFPGILLFQHLFLVLWVLLQALLELSWRGCRKRSPNRFDGDSSLRKVRVAKGQII